MIKIVALILGIPIAILISMFLVSFVWNHIALQVGWNNYLPWFSWNCFAIVLGLSFFAFPRSLFKKDN